MTRPWALAGVSGSGKTTVARLVAAATGRRALDLDEVIGHGRVLELIRAGEPALREAEAGALARLATEDPAIVVALGGGTPLGADACRVLDQGWLVAWLDAPAETCVARCAPDAPQERPVLAAARRAGAEALADFVAQRREAAARVATLRVDASAAAADVARAVLDGLEMAENEPRERRKRHQGPE